MMLLNATWARTGDVRSLLPLSNTEPTIRVQEAEWSDSVAIALLDLFVSIEEDSAAPAAPRRSSRRVIGELFRRNTSA